MPFFLYVRAGRSAGAGRPLSSHPGSGGWPPRGEGGKDGLGSIRGSQWGLRSPLRRRSPEKDRRRILIFGLNFVFFVKIARMVV